jgi:hypothetical protein
MLPAKDLILLFYFTLRNCFTYKHDFSYFCNLMSISFQRLSDCAVNLDPVCSGPFWADPDHIGCLNRHIQ